MPSAMLRHPLSLGSNRRAARTRHPVAIVLDRGVEIAAASMLLEKGVEVGEQASVTLGRISTGILRRAGALEA
jgi:serine acetyltransferase